MWLGHSNKTNIHHALSCASSCVPTIPHGDPMQSLCYFLHFTDESETQKLRSWHQATQPKMVGSGSECPARTCHHYTCLPDRMGWTRSGAAGSAEAELEQERGPSSVGSGVLGRWESGLQERERLPRHWVPREAEHSSSEVGWRCVQSHRPKSRVPTCGRHTHVPRMSYVGVLRQTSPIHPPDGRGFWGHLLPPPPAWPLWPKQPLT